MGQQKSLKLGLASRMLLASLVLLLPLAVFVLILVRDRNKQIDVTGNEITGLHYLFDLRDLLELMPRHMAAHHMTAEADSPAHHDVGSTVASVNETLDRLSARINADGDLFAIREPFAELLTRWNAIDHDRHTEIGTAVFNRNSGLQKQVLALFARIGHATHLELDGSLDSSQLARLVAE